MSKVFPSYRSFLEHAEKNLAPAVWPHPISIQRSHQSLHCLTCSCHGKLSGWLEARWLPHLGKSHDFVWCSHEPPVPTPAENVFVGVCPMATCFQNAQFNMKKVAMPIFTTDEMAHKTTLHTGYQWYSPLMEAAIMRTKCRVEKCSTVHQLPEEKLWKRQGEAFQWVVQLCSKCAHLLLQNLVDLKKKSEPRCYSEL